MISNDNNKVAYEKMCIRFVGTDPFPVGVTLVGIKLRLYFLKSLSQFFLFSCKMLIYRRLQWSRCLGRGSDSFDAGIVVSNPAQAWMFVLALCCAVLCVVLIPRPGVPTKCRTDASFQK
jgi:hypothetical protein